MYQSYFPLLLTHTYAVLQPPMIISCYPRGKPYTAALYIASVFFSQVGSPLPVIPLWFILLNFLWDLFHCLRFFWGVFMLRYWLFFSLFASPQLTRLVIVCGLDSVILRKTWNGSLELGRSIEIENRISERMTRVEHVWGLESSLIWII